MVKMAKLLAKTEHMEKRRMREMEVERMHIQDTVTKDQAKSKIYQNLDQMSQKTGKIEVQEYKGNDEHHLGYAHVNIHKKKTGLTTTNKHLFYFFSKQMGKL